MSRYFLDADVFVESMLQKMSKMGRPWLSRFQEMAVHSPKVRYLLQLSQARQCGR